MLKKIGIITGMLVFVVAILVITANLNDEIIVKEETFKPVHVFRLGEGAELSAGESGFMEFYLINISDAQGYIQNTSATLEAWAEANMPGLTPYGDADEFHIETESEKTFVILVRYCFNATHAKDGDDWNGADTDVQLTLTCTNWLVGDNIDNVSGTRYESANNSEYTLLYENFVWDNSGTGYQIADDATWTCVEIYGEAKF